MTAQEMLANSSEHFLQSLALSEGELSEGQALDAHGYLQEDRLSLASESTLPQSRQHNDDTHRLPPCCSTRRKAAMAKPGASWRATR